MMRTFTGRNVNLKSFSKDDIDLRDIAISLSRQIRYLGHTSHSWSVAQHTILGGMIAKTVGMSDDIQKSFFLHDAHETWFQDIISPIVAEYTTLEYKAARASADRVIYDFFGLGRYLDNDAIVTAVKLLDKVSCVIEQIFLRPGYDYQAERGDMPHEVTRMVDYLITEGFKIARDLVDMTPTEVAQNMYEVMMVLHFEETQNVEIVVDTETV